MSQDLFRKEAIEHKRERLWGNYTRRETVNGYLVLDQGLAKIYARSNGIVTKTLVKEGNFVEAGTQLITVSTGRSTEESSDLDAIIIQELTNSQSELQQKLQEISPVDGLRVIDKSL